VEENKFITYEEAKEITINGGQVLFHYHDKTAVIDENTKLDDLRWELKANNKLRVHDILTGKYKVIQ